MEVAVNLPSTSTAPPQHSPVLFHPYHGENVELLEHRQRALRRASFEKGFVFSERPLEEREQFFVCIENVEGGWSGHLRIGLTTRDPSTRPNINELSSESWVVCVSSSLLPLSTTTGQPAFSATLPTDKGSLIGIYYERTEFGAKLHLVLNGFDVCPETERLPIDKPLYALVDVFGSTKEVRVVLPEPRAPRSLFLLCSQQVRALRKIGRCFDSMIPPKMRELLEADERFEKTLMEFPGFILHRSIFAPAAVP